MITNDITHLLHVPFDVAEAVKLEHGHAIEREVDAAETFLVQPFGEGLPQEFHRSDLAMVIESRVEELVEMIHSEIKRSGYDGLLRAGMVLTGGCAQLPGLRELAEDILGMPVRVAKPERLTGMADLLRNPSYSTSVGLLRLGLQMDAVATAQPATNGGGSPAKVTSFLSGLFKRLLPDDGER